LGVGCVEEKEEVGEEEKEEVEEGKEVEDCLRGSSQVARPNQTNTWTSRQPGASISEPPAEADNVSLQMIQHCRWNGRQTPLPQYLLQLVPHFIGSHQIHQVAEVYLQPHLPNSIASAFLVCIGIGPPLP